MPHMNWQQTLQVKTRDPGFLWRMVLGIVASGVVLGWIAGQVTGGQNEILSLGAGHHGWKQIEQLASQGDWWEVWWQIPRWMLGDLSRPGVVFLALLAGACWLIFLLQAMRWYRGWQLGLVLIALACGVLSVWPTQFFALWQEYRWHLTESAELAAGLRFFVLGVGLREELAKLLCLLPVLAVAVYRRDEAAALLLSACVGLGFAVNENLSYLAATHGSDTLGRFLTANPLHMALTGLIGLAVYRACLDFRNQGPQALAIFGVLVFAHGLYDAAIVLPALAEYSILGMILFALVMYQFFHELRVLRRPGSDVISLTATFLVGISLLTAATFIYISALAGTSAAADNLMTDLIGLALMVYLFLREMPETLISV